MHTKQTVIVVTGAAGFIGSDFVLGWIASRGNDGLGRDRCNGTDAAMLGREFGWRVVEWLHARCRKTIRWYLDNVP